jgi:hypothetical protein
LVSAVRKGLVAWFAVAIGAATLALASYGAMLYSSNEVENLAVWLGFLNVQLQVTVTDCRSS